MDEQTLIILWRDRAGTSTITAEAFKEIEGNHTVVMAGYHSIAAAYNQCADELENVLDK